jgi:hypothetical protein
MSHEDLSLQLDLAAAQIITSVLVTLGATLFALSIGIQLTIPQAIRDALSQVVIEQGMISEIQQGIVQQALDNYIVLLTATGAVLILAGIAYGSAKIGKMRKRIGAARDLESF